MLKPIAIVLVHYPVLDRRGDVVTSAVTNLDIHDLARLAKTYNIARYYLVTPALEQQQLVARIVSHWRDGAGAVYNPDRCEALDCLRVMNSCEDACNDWQGLVGQKPLILLTGANQPNGMSFDEARALAAQHPLLLVFGTGHGLALGLHAPDRPWLVPVRAGQYNHLSVRTAAAIVLDRLLGDAASASQLP